MIRTTGGEVAAVPATSLATDVGWVGGLGWDEPGLDQHPLGSKVLVTSRRLERVQAVPGRCELAQFPERSGRYPAAGYPLRDPVADLSRAFPYAVQV